MKSGSNICDKFYVSFVKEICTVSKILELSYLIIPGKVIEQIQRNLAVEVLFVEK